MGLQDATVVRTAADLEKKYNLSKLTRNIETNSDSLLKVENELNNMYNALMINLKDVLDSQSEISLWFYSGIPTTSNSPYINWSNKSEHIGDIYYDKSTGYVYQYKEVNGTGLWEINTTPDLIEAMAITNSELDTSEDHERKVFFTTPVIPYSNGDWWIKEDGSVYICQISKTSGEYETDDFVDSSKYTESVAEKIGEEIKVLKGTITMISDSYAKFTDLATGGSTIIDGANIVTGTIDANKVKIANNNVVIDSEGIKLNNGAKVVGDNGLMNTYIYEKERMMGYSRDYMFNEATGEYDHISPYEMLINFTLPTGLAVTNATVQLIHSPIQWEDENGTFIAMGKTQNIKLAKATNLYNRRLAASPNSEVWFDDNTTPYSEISEAFGTDGWTPPTTPTKTNYPTETTTSINIKSHLSAGLNQLKIYVPNAVQTWSETDIVSRTGYLVAILKIDGYMTYS